MLIEWLELFSNKRQAKGVFIEAERNSARKSIWKLNWDAFLLGLLFLTIPASSQRLRWVYRFADYWLTPRARSDGPEALAVLTNAACRPWNIESLFTSREGSRVRESAPNLFFGLGRLPEFTALFSVLLNFILNKNFGGLLRKNNRIVQVILILLQNLPKWLLRFPRWYNVTMNQNVFGSITAGTDLAATTAELQEINRKFLPADDIKQLSVHLHRLLKLNDGVVDKRYWIESRR